MREFKLVHCLSITTMMTLMLIMSLKLIFNPYLSQAQQEVGHNLNIALLPSITDAEQLMQYANPAYFSHISIHNQSTNTHINHTFSTPYSFFSTLFPIAPSTVHSPNQIIEYSIKNEELYRLFHSITLIGALFLLILMFAFKMRHQQLSKKITLLNINAEKNIQFIQAQELKINALAEKVNIDHLTHLKDNHSFRKALTALLSAQDTPKHAILCLIRLNQLSTIKAHRGSQQGEKFTQDMAAIIRDVAIKHKHIEIFRLQDGDFSLIAHDMDTNHAEHLGEQLKVRFDEYQALYDLDSVAFTGMVLISSGQLPEQVLARTDIALAKSQSKGFNAWTIQSKSLEEDEEVGVQHWQNILTQIITEKSILLLKQPIHATHQEMNQYQEIYTRFIDDKGLPFPTEIIFTMAQRTGLVIKLEQLIIETVMSKFKIHSDHQTKWGINISTEAIQNSSFLVWLERLLLKNPDVAALLTFEVEETILNRNLAAGKRAFKMFQRSGSRSAISNFGKDISSFRLFTELQPNFIKIDASLICHIDTDSGNQQYLRLIIEAAHRINCQVIAEGVEHSKQQEAIEKMFIDGIQGFLIARPSPL